MTRTDDNSAPRPAQPPRSRARRRTLFALPILLGFVGAGTVAVNALSCTTLASSPLTTAATAVEATETRQLKRQISTWDTAWRSEKAPTRAAAFSKVYVAGEAMESIATSDAFQPRSSRKARVDDIKVSGDLAWATVLLEPGRGSDTPGEKVQQVWRKSSDGWRIQHERFEPLPDPSRIEHPY